ncbi:MAG: VOC family protein [Bacteroidota bacterium]
MKIQKLRLYASQLPSLFDFYHDKLGFEEIFLSNEELHIQVGGTELVFEKHPLGFIYHFAFLIPHAQIDAAIEYLEDRNIDLLPYKGKQVIDFTTGKAIYFYDPAGNIVEFIDRPNLNLSADGKFSTKQILRLNEIGMPVNDPLLVSKSLRESFNIRLVQPEILGEHFCWIGDYEGVFIVVKEGRNWLPTSLPAMFNDFEADFIESGVSFSLKFVNGQITDSR